MYKFHKQSFIVSSFLDVWNNYISGLVFCLLYLQCAAVNFDLILIILIFILHCTTTYYYVLFTWRCMYVSHIHILLNSTYLLTVPSVLWHCWLGGRKGIRPVKTWVVGCWRGYLSGARCRLAYGPADATATHCLLLVKGPLNAHVCVTYCHYYHCYTPVITTTTTITTTATALSVTSRHRTTAADLSNADLMLMLATAAGLSTGRVSQLGWWDIARISHSSSRWGFKTKGKTKEDLERGCTWGLSST